MGAQATHVTDGLTELLALKGVRDRLVERALSETDHLCGDTDTALVQDLDRVPVAPQPISL